MASSHSVSELRMVILGRTGVGKSATCNNILGREAFKETETKECEAQRGRVEDRDILVIDTPGFNTTSLTTDQWRTETEKCVALSSPGPDMFLLVIRLGRFADEERNAVKWIQENFGEEALRFSMILFIGKEDMTRRQFITFSQDECINHFSSQFGGGYHVINSKREVNPAQITKLLEKIDDVVQRNGGQFYTQQMYQNNLMKKREEATNKESVEQTVELMKSLEKNENAVQKKRGQICTHEIHEKVLTKTREEVVNEKQDNRNVKRVADNNKPESVMQNLTTHTVELQKQSMDMTSLDKPIKTDNESVNKPVETENNKVKQEVLAEFEIKSKHAVISKKEDFRRQMECRKEMERRKWEEEKGATGGVTSDQVSDVRIVLLGGAGEGRSSTGNTILGREAFGQDFLNITTKCKRQDGMLGNKTITVIDTQRIPLNISEYCKQFEECLSLSHPGPHVFLLVINSPMSLSSSYNVCIYSLFKLIGHEFSKRTLVLLTFGDIWLGRQEMLNCNPELQQLVRNCGGIYHIFNNEEKEERTQVTELMEKIDRIIQQNGGQHYTKEMYQEAQRKRERKETEEKIKSLEQKINALKMEHDRLYTEIHQCQNESNEEGGCCIL